LRRVFFVACLLFASFLNRKGISDDSSRKSLPRLGVSGADPVKLRVPARYANPASSGLEYTIDAANRRLSIDLPK